MEAGGTRHTCCSRRASLLLLYLVLSIYKIISCLSSQHRVSCIGSADSSTRSAGLDFHHQRRTRKPLLSRPSLSIRAKNSSGLGTTMYEHTLEKSVTRQKLTLATGTNNILLRTGRAERCWSAKIYILSGPYTTRRTSQADTAL